MDACELFKEIIKPSMSLIADHKKNPSSMYRLNTSLILLVSSAEKNVGNSILSNLVFFYILLLSMHMGVQF